MIFLGIEFEFCNYQYCHPHYYYHHHDHHHHHYYYYYYYYSYLCQ